MALCSWILFIVLVSNVVPDQSTDVYSTYSSDVHNVSGEISHTKSHHGIHVANWRWDEIGVFLTFTIFIVVSGLAKVAFHHVSSISEHIPESCLMIIIGVSVGGILYACGISQSKGENEDIEDHFTFPVFTPRFFFLMLLPPVVLEAAYSLYNRAFSYNVCTILLYAVVGTIFNTFTIGPLLYSLWYTDLLGASLQDLNMLQCLVFSALISAVDPVAVLAIFQEVGVNQDLYYLVFGESLLNDAVTIVLYSTIVTFCEMPKIPASDYGLAVLSFFTISLGGMLIGTLFGLMTALITKTTQSIRVVEPLAVLGIAYLSYLSAELFHWSGIISITACGLVQAHYALKNISHKSYTTVKYFIKMLSSTCDSIIFLFLGMVLVNDRHVWHTGFVLWTLILCLVCRFIGVFLLTALANKLRVRKIDLQEQFIMAYGGLRGAIAFSLVEMLEENVVHLRSMFVTTTLVVIIFTVFVQGSTIKPLVKLLHIATASKEKLTMTDELNENVIGSMMAGIEEITGVRGDFYIRMKLEHIDDLFLKKIFLCKSPDNDLTRFYEKLCLTDHFTHLYGPATLVEDDKAKLINKPFDEDLTLPIVSSTRTTCRFSDLFPGVELRQRVDTIHEDPNRVSRDTLRKAISSHSYNKFHQCYNPNLINDHYQELEDQLKLRHLKARRIASVASQLRRQVSEVAPSAYLEDFAYPRRKIHSELEGMHPEDMEGIDTILSRTEERILKQRSLSLSESSKPQQSPSSLNQPISGSPSDISKFVWSSAERQKPENSSVNEASEKDQMLQSLDKSDEVFVNEKSFDSKV